MKLMFGALALLTLTLAPSAQAASRPDLRVAALPRATAAPGATVTFKPVVVNAGRARATRSVLRVVWSKDAKRDKRDKVLAKANVRALARGKKVTLRVTVKLPATSGTLLACADDLKKLREAREANNCGAGRMTIVQEAPMSVPAPQPAPAPPASSSPAPQAPNAACAATDVPDLAHTDSDCDGIDGTAAASIFVSATGDDANPGTMAAPKRTIIAGITAAAQAKRQSVLIAAGEYAERPYLVNGISLYGGYDAATWQRSDTKVSWIKGDTTIGGTEGLRANNILDATTLQRLRISAPNATSGSSYGIAASSAPRLRLERVEVFAGNGAKGASGQPGSDGEDGQPGANGKAGSCDGNVAGTGGAGGGTSGFAFGGAGGTGGTGSLMSSGKDGSPGWGLVLGGDGGVTGDPGAAGENGANGLNGTGGTPGEPGVGGTIVNGFWQGGQGGQGGQGESGEGGGGGGGGGGQYVTYFYGGGNGGGGGGEGGHGGSGGKGGKGGGGSFGVFALNSLGLVISDSTIASGAAGNGGYGGYPGNGGLGAKGGDGAKACLSEIGAGGNGGHGGMGAKGGLGGSGAGGPSYALFGTGGNVTVTNSVLTHGAAGQGGTPGTAAQRFGV